MRLLPPLCGCSTTLPPGSSTMGKKEEEEDVARSPPLSPPGPHVAGLVLARGGSEGIPLKNLAPLGPSRRPLLSWALDPMLEVAKERDDSGHDVGFTSVWVSTEHPAIAACATKHQGVQVFWRSPLYARSSSPSVEAVQEFLQARPEVDVVCLVQCTSPFIQAPFLRRALRLLKAGQHDSIFSVTRTKKFRWREVTQEHPTTQALNFDPSQRLRRQDWKGDLVENGMFYIARRHLVEKGILQGGKCTYVEVPPEYSLEIDTPLDMVFAESVIVAQGGAKEGEGDGAKVESGETCLRLASKNF